MYKEISKENAKLCVRSARGQRIRAGLCIAGPMRLYMELLLLCLALFNVADGDNLFARSKNVVTVTDASMFFELIHAPEPALVVFFQPECPRSAAALPAVEGASKTLWGSALVAAVNCEEASTTTLCQRMGVAAFPTFILYAYGSELEYRGPRQALPMHRFVSQSLRTPAVVRVEASTVDAWFASDTDKAKVIVFVASPHTPIVIHRLAQERLATHSFGLVWASSPDAASLMERFGVEVRQSTSAAAHAHALPAVVAVRSGHCVRYDPSFGGPALKLPSLLSFVDSGKVTKGSAVCASSTVFGGDTNSDGTGEPPAARDAAWSTLQQGQSVVMELTPASEERLCPPRKNAPLCLIFVSRSPHDSPITLSTAKRIAVEFGADGTTKKGSKGRGGPALRTVVLDASRYPAFIKAFDDAVVGAAGGDDAVVGAAGGDDDAGGAAGGDDDGGGARRSSHMLLWNAPKGKFSTSTESVSQSTARSFIYNFLAGSSRFQKLPSSPRWE